MFKLSSLINDVSLCDSDVINSLRMAVSHRLAGFWIQRRIFRSEQGQATVEYLLVIGVVVVAVAAAFYQRDLFEALAKVFNNIARQVASPYP